MTQPGTLVPTPPSVLFWAGREGDEHPGEVTAWNCDLTSLMELLDEAGRIVVRDPLSFPWEHLGESHRDLRISVQLPRDLDGPAIASALAKPLLQYLTALDVVVEPRPEIREHLEHRWPQLRYCWRDALDDAVEEPPTELVTTPRGEFTAFPDDVITRHLQEYGAHQRSLLNVLDELLVDATTLVDVGAHIGTISLPATAARPGLRTVAIEGDPAAFRLLERNVDSFGLTDRVRPVLAVVGDGTDGYVAEKTPGNTGATTYVKRRHLRRHPHAVRSQTLDALLGDAGLERGGTVVKVDVEGSELAVLRSGANVIAAIRPVLVVHVPDQRSLKTRAARRALAEWLDASGYDCSAVTGPRNSAVDAGGLTALPGTDAWPADIFDLVARPRSDAEGTGEPA